MALAGTADVAGRVDTFPDSGKLDEASNMLKASLLLPSHVYPEQTINARLVHYLAGYVAPHSHSWYIGVCTVIELFTRLILDSVVPSNVCAGCERTSEESNRSYEEWKPNHLC